MAELPYATSIAAISGVWPSAACPDKASRRSFSSIAKGWVARHLPVSLSTVSLRSFALSRPRMSCGWSCDSPDEELADALLAGAGGV